jgi:competence protein ComEC
MSKYVRIGIFGFFGGVALGSFFGLGLWFAIFVIFLSGLILGVSQVSLGAKPFLGRMIIPFVLFSFALGMLRIELAPVREDSVLKNLIGKSVALEGVVVDEPDNRENSVHLVVRVDEGEKILLVIRRYPEFEYGDKVIVRGKLASPKNFEEENGREFDYVSYLEKDGIFSVMNFPTLEVVARGEGNRVVSSLFRIKHAFLRGVSQVLPEPHASLLGGLLVGGKHSLGKELEDDFRTAGVVHIIVLSGFNITLVAYFFMSVFVFLPARLRIVFGAVSIFLFTIMTGAGAATVRAAIMAGLIIFARATGRTADMLHLLFIAGFFMVLWNPAILLHDPSFQLSFLATLGLLLLSEKISARLTFIPKKFLLREITAATLSTQIFVLPLLLYQTGNLSLVALPANLFILSAIPGAMLFGFLTGLFSFISMGAASLFGFITYLFLAYILGAVNFFSHLPFAAIAVPEFPVWVLVGAYLALGIFVWRRNNRTSKK